MIIIDNKEKVIEAFRNPKTILNISKVSEISGIEKKEVDKIMKELKKEDVIISPKSYWTLQKNNIFFTFYI